MASLGLIALVDLVDVVHQSRFAGLVDDYVAGRASSSGLFAYDSFTVSLAWLYVAIFLACVVTFLAWLSRVVENAPAIGAGQPPHGPRGAIGWWFAPFANWFVPYRIVADLSRRLALTARQGAGPYLVLAWWLTWVAANFLANAPRLLASADTVDELKSAVAVGMIASAVNLLAAILAIAVILTIQGREDVRAVVATSITGSAIDALPGATV